MKTFNPTQAEENKIRNLQLFWIIYRTITTQGKYIWALQALVMARRARDETRDDSSI